MIRIAQTLLSTAIYTSSILGVQILLMDKWLWNAAPTHALGLVIFVAVDAVLLAAMLEMPRLATFGAVVASAAQLSAMLGDIMLGQPSDVSAVAFRNYLLADTAFISLLVTQGMILALATALTIPLATSHKLALHQARKQ